MDELLAVGLHHIVSGSTTGDPYAAAVAAELRRLYRAAGEPLPVLLRTEADSVTTYTLAGETLITDVVHGAVSYTLDVGRAA